MSTIDGRVARVSQRSSGWWCIHDQDCTAQMRRTGEWEPWCVDDTPYDVWPTREAAEQFIAEQADKPAEPSDAERIAELERLNLEAQNRIADLCVLVGHIEQCRSVEGDSVTILCDNPEADSIETQSAVEVCGDYTGYELQRFYGRTWEEAIAKAAKASQRHYSETGE